MAKLYVRLDSYKHELRGTLKGVSYTFTIHDRSGGFGKKMTVHESKLPDLNIKRHPGLTIITKYISTPEGAETIYNLYKEVNKKRERGPFVC